MQTVASGKYAHLSLWAAGLGKTIQTIAFCAAILGKTGTDADAFPQENIAGVK